MAERDRYIPGVPCWADTSQPDPKAAVDFYRGLFGWEFEEAMPPGVPGTYCIARLRGGDVAAVSSAPEGSPTAWWNTYVWVDSADDTAAKVRQAGGAVVMEPSDVMDAGRSAVFTDPEGAAFCVWQAKRHRGAKIVNEPGSVNFNDLATHATSIGPRRSTARCSAGRRCRWGPASRCGRCRATATTSRRTIRSCASGWPRSAHRQASRTSSRPSTRSLPTSPTPGALGHHVRGRRRRRHRSEGHGPRRDRRRPAVRRAVGAHDGPHRSAGRDVRGQQVRAREPGRRQPSGRGQRGLSLETARLALRARLLSAERPG